MIFWASSETDSKVGDSVEGIRRIVEPFLNAALARSSLATLDAKIRYVPIVMPPELAIRYPARSRLKKKERVYQCAPQLDYSTFLSETYENQLTCYLEGLRECVLRLPELGASKVQCNEFVEILETCRADLLGNL